MGRRRLIICADDFGAGPLINRGIADAVRAGTVTAVSVLANGPALTNAVDRSVEGVDYGVHLNYTEGLPIASADEIRSLIGRDGRFYPLPHFLLRLSWGLIRAVEVERETEAQILRLRALGFDLQHADSHQHVHVHPRLAGPIARVLGRAGLPRVRRPLDWSPAATGPKAMVLAALTWASDSHYRGFLQSVATRGIARRPTTLGTLESIVAGSPPALTELIVHPRAAAPVDPTETPVPDRAQREAEWRVLVDPACRLLFDRYDVHLSGSTGLVNPEVCSG